VSTSPLERRAILFLLVACALWGISFPLGKALVLATEQANGRPLEVADAVASNVLRYFLGAALLLMVSGARVRPTRDEWVHGAWLGFAVLSAVTLITVGVGQTDASVAAFLLQLGTVHVAGFACLERRTAPSGWLVGALLLALGGALVLSGATPQKLRLGPGAGWILAATLFTAVHILLVSWPKYRHNRPLPLTWAMFLCTGAMGLPVLTLSEGRQTAWSTVAHGPAPALFLIVVVASIFLPFWLMNAWQRHTTSLRATFIYMSEPVFATMAGSFLPGWIAVRTGLDYANETIRFSLLAGGALTLAANLLIARSPEGRPWETDAEDPANPSGTLSGSDR
jgi:drug/metabolite transporter (DMT)-like permease